MSKLDGLQLKFRERLELAIERMNLDAELKSHGVQCILIAEGLRTLPVQMAYYARGRMPDAADVRAYFRAASCIWVPTDQECTTKSTWTLDSRHFDGEAADLAPSRDGQEMWWKAPDAVWARMCAIGKAYGLACGYEWPDKKKDPGHYERMA